MSRSEQKETTRARVLEAARESVANRDVREVSMQDIARRARVSVGALYFHFQSRDVLIDAVVAELHDRLVADIKVALVATKTKVVPEAIRRWASAYIDTLGSFRPYVSLYANHIARTMSVDLLRSSGTSAPLVQMLNATLVSMTSTTAVTVDVPLLAASVGSLWRAAALSRVTRPLADAPMIADSLAEITLSVLTTSCPGILAFDARHLARAMAQFLK